MYSPGKIGLTLLFGAYDAVGDYSSHKIYDEVITCFWLMHVCLSANVVLTFYCVMKLYAQTDYCC